MEMELREIRDAAERYLAAHHPPSVARRMGQGNDGDDEAARAALWRDIVAQGWPAMLLPAEEDGLGLGLREAVIVAQAAGRHLLSFPLMANMAVLPAIAQGISVPGQDDGNEANPHEAEHMRGEMRAVLAGDRLFAWADIDAEGVAWVEGAAPGRVILALRDGDLLRLNPVAGAPALDPTQAVACLRSFQASTVSTLPPRIATALSLRLRLLRSAELLGAADASLRAAAAYAVDRHQFGKPIGANQAIKHRLAENWMALDDAGLAIASAAQALDESSARAAAEVDMAQWLAIDGGLRTAQQAIQTHGAMGITWECDAHLYLKRALRLASLLENSVDQAGILARLWERDTWGGMASG